MYYIYNYVYYIHIYYTYTYIYIYIYIYMQKEPFLLKYITSFYRVHLKIINTKGFWPAKVLRMLQPWFLRNRNPELCASLTLKIFFSLYLPNYYMLLWTVQKFPRKIDWFIKLWGKMDCKWNVNAATSNFFFFLKTCYFILVELTQQFSYIWRNNNESRFNLSKA